MSSPRAVYKYQRPPPLAQFYWIESGRTGLVTLGGPERSRKEEYSGGRLRYLDAAIEAAKRFWVGPPRAEILYITRVYIASQFRSDKAGLTAMVGLLSNPILRTEDALCSIEDVMHSKGMRISSVKPDVQEYD